MRAFLIACLSVIVVAVCSVLALGALQEPSGTAFSTAGARIEPSWNWRHMFDQSKTPSGSAARYCETVKPLHWMFVDFSDRAGEPCTNQ